MIAELRGDQFRMPAMEPLDRRSKEDIFGCRNFATVDRRDLQHPLKQELGMDKVVHYVVSQLPVIGADPAVIWSEPLASSSNGKIPG
ncbi:hypothetical protein [Bradyrhizobium frederickii]|nr:hypothetical protein [Bradyrhizobium frederickii]